MATNQMRYIIVLRGRSSNYGYVQLDENNCKIGATVSPFNQDYQYEVIYIDGYDIILKPISQGALHAHKESIK